LGGRYCNERCGILDVLEKSIKQMRDPRHKNVEDLMQIALPALREAHWFALGVEVPPTRTATDGTPK
jgi:hypothetical protein